jgi:hypothetical protein
VHTLLGDDALAEEDYRRAVALGMSPGPLKEVMEKQKKLRV